MKAGDKDHEALIAACQDGDEVAFVNLLLAEAWSEAYRHGVDDMAGTARNRHDPEPTLDVARRNPYRVKP